MAGCEFVSYVCSPSCQRRVLGQRGCQGSPFLLALRPVLAVGPVTTVKCLVSNGLTVLGGRLVTRVLRVKNNCYCDTHAVSRALTPALNPISTCLMKLVALPAFLIAASITTLAHTTTITYRITDAPSYAVTYYSDPSNLRHRVTAGIEGAFSITYEQDSPPALSSFRLFLRNVSQNFEVPGLDIDDFEGKPVQGIMSHDLEGAPSTASSSANVISFLAPYDPPPVNGQPVSSMRVDFGDRNSIVRLSSLFTPAGGPPGPFVVFQSLTATLVPERQQPH